MSYIYDYQYHGFRKGEGTDCNLSCFHLEQAWHRTTVCMKFCSLAHQMTMEITILPVEYAYDFLQGQTSCRHFFYMFSYPLPDKPVMKIN